MDVFGLDPELAAEFGAAPLEAFAGQTIPFDTSLSAIQTSERLGTPLPTVKELLACVPGRT